MRNLDHFVMPVADLGLARARFSDLGFNVAPNARHPFGTENCCVFFGDGTFIEPLAIGDTNAYQTALEAGNAFVKGHHDFCQGKHPQGFSHLVVKSENAKADDEAFRRSFISGGEILDFGRTFTKSDGSTGEVAFSLAFAKFSDSPNVSFFACEVVKAVLGGRGTLVDHANGVLEVKHLIACDESPGHAYHFLSSFLDCDMQQHRQYYEFGKKNGSIRLFTPRNLQKHYGLVRAQNSGLNLIGLVFKVANIGLLHDLLALNMITTHDRQNQIIVPPAPGQGATLIFEE